MAGAVSARSDEALGGRRTPPKARRPEPAPLATSPLIEALSADVRHRGVTAVEEFWADAGASAPLVEHVPGHPRERIVTFVWRDAEAEEVLLFVNRLTDERQLADSLMRRLGDSDLWHLSYRMDSDWRASYSFLSRRRGERAAWRDAADQIALRAALDRGHPDPRNPERSHNHAGVAQSVVTLPDAPPQPWIARIGQPVVRAEERHAPGGRRVWVHRASAPTPQSGPAHGEGMPLVVILDGEVWMHVQNLVATVDQLVGHGLIPPAVFVFVDSGGRDRRWRELGDADGSVYIVDDLIPWAQAHLGASTDARSVVVVGQSLGALTALRCGIRHPDRVGRVLSQSASLWQDDLSADVSAGRLTSLRVYLEVGAQEWVLRRPNGVLADQLARAGADVQFVEYNGGHDYACWRGGVADGLIALLGG